MYNLFDNDGITKLACLSRAGVIFETVFKVVKRFAESVSVFRTVLR